jgi:hypothetical protein
MTAGVYKDLRGTPKGPAEIWETSRMILPRFRKRRIRETLTIGFCDEGWHGDSGTADGPSEPICHTLPMMHISGEPEPKWWRNLDGYHEFHANRPCHWKVTSSSKNGYWTHFYCIAEFPDEYRELTRRPEDRVIKPGPRTFARREHTTIDQKEAS